MTGETSVSSDVNLLKKRVEVAAGRAPADLVLKGGQVVNVMSCEIQAADVAIVDGRIAGLGSYDDAQEIVDVAGRFVCPGLIDAHVHIESSMLDVPEFARVVSTCGTTAVIADPHEIANVMGAEGIRYMLAAARGCSIDVCVMASS